MAKFFIASVLGLASLQGAMAAPAAEVFPEVIPGPGLPSLADLGLTSAQLYKMPTPKQLAARLDPLNKRFDAKCGPAENAYTNVNDIIACYHYLNNLGTTMCVGSSANNVFCTAGLAHVTGSTPFGPTQSYCRDVAAGVLWAIDSCTRPDQSCAGSASAYGNGNLIITSSHRINW
ncbi:uncharacterized protein B0H64DRAFT_100563 [Chaetomium fimeti]|uniref:Secreted protein n=1 Tax=Chaetomium fimeti TaxID=1854472 RepID=A0AAE0LWP9_9PEZI|nr:hypothetical protein B0H64DRAFT_100563 [Chaetomium fimeti]